MVNNEIILDQKATEEIKKVIGGSDSGGADVKFIISVNSEQPAQSTIISYSGSLQQLRDKISAGDTISVQCLFRGHYTDDSNLDFNIIGKLRNNFVWLMNENEIMAQFSFELEDESHLFADGKYTIYWAYEDAPIIIGFIPSN